MGSLAQTITITTELRPCYVDGKKALFHRWTENGTTPPVKIIDTRLTEKSVKRIEKKIQNGILSPAADIEVLRVIRGIVEYEDGTIDEVMPQQIKFDDNKIKEYVFTSGTDTNEILLLRENLEALQKRFNHLMKSDLVRQYDAYDRKTHTYKNDILKLDEEFNKFKSAYEILLNLTNCNTCEKAHKCEFVKWGDKVVYNCPHFIESAE